MCWTQIFPGKLNWTGPPILTGKWLGRLIMESADSRHERVVEIQCVTPKCGYVQGIWIQELRFWKAAPTPDRLRSATGKRTATESDSRHRPSVKRLNIIALITAYRSKSGKRHLAHTDLWDSLDSLQNTTFSGLPLITNTPFVHGPSQCRSSSLLCHRSRNFFLPSNVCE